ncbi:DUF6773 family protein [Clostridium cellulovorans]|uniref:Uncharacterized protein n=1 Tax=Clostridium cellulovorans (strain ATCC 35296 / DSM 3052 / OCM 3 / 743B) TaxID=573061 RepID=D9SNQ5_CLOC7|nr:DUF6773 family protein [Clostridium cellulovorans]ADL49926.1 hypothetical protein Clocel_0137 [Clostridium cellulovorans 743B]
MKLFKSKYDDERINSLIYKASFNTVVLLQIALLGDFIVRTLILNHPLRESISSLIIFIIGAIYMCTCIIINGAYGTMVSENKFNLKRKRVYIYLIGSAFVAIMINITDGDDFYSKKGLLKFGFDFVAFFILTYFSSSALNKLLTNKKGR